ncbi:unnamed protein product [Calypogeia fissa]
MGPVRTGRDGSHGRRDRSAAGTGSKRDPVLLEYRRSPVRYGSKGRASDYRTNRGNPHVVGIRVELEILNGTEAGAGGRGGGSGLEKEFGLSWRSFGIGERKRLEWFSFEEADPKVC